MQYILLRTDDGRDIYQCVQNGNVVAFKDASGNAVVVTGGSTVINANPETPAWHVEPPPVVVQPEPQPVVRTVTRLEYMNRFTDSELAGLWTAAKTVVQIELWLEKFKLAEFINLDDPRTVAGLQALEGAGLLTEGRANEILA